MYIYTYVTLCTYDVHSVSLCLPCALIEACFLILLLQSILILSIPKALNNQELLEYTYFIYAQIDGSPLPCMYVTQSMQVQHDLIGYLQYAIALLHFNNF